MLESNHEQQVWFQHGDKAQASYQFNCLKSYSQKAANESISVGVAGCNLFVKRRP